MNAVVTPINWQALGACTVVDPELFFAYDGEPDDRRSVREDKAKAVCARCAVRDLCLRDAVEGEITHGVYGGLSERERADLIRASRKEAAA